MVVAVGALDAKEAAGEVAAAQAVAKGGFAGGAKKGSNANYKDLAYVSAANKETNV